MKVLEVLEAVTPDEYEQDTSIGDFIITAFELGELTFDEAVQQLRDNGMEHYITELTMADELMKGDKSINRRAISNSIN